MEPRGGTGTARVRGGGHERVRGRDVRGGGDDAGDRVGSGRRGERVAAREPRGGAERERGGRERAGGGRGGAAEPVCGSCHTELVAIPGADMSLMRHCYACGGAG